MMKKADEISRDVALIGLQNGAIQINTKNPFLDKDGKLRPVIINWNVFPFNHKQRHVIVDGLVDIIRHSVGLNQRKLLIAGSETGMPWAAFVAEKFQDPLVYIQNDYKDNNPKKHEKCNPEIDLSNHIAILIDDVISTGRKNGSTVASIREMNGICNLCISIIDCGFSEAEKVFTCEFPFKRNGFEVPQEYLKSPCEKKSLLNLPQLIKVAWDNGFIEKEEEKTLLEWMENPEYWGSKHRFTSQRKI